MTAEPDATERDSRVSRDDARDGGDGGDYEYALAHEEEHARQAAERPLVQVTREDDGGDGDWSYAMAHDVPPSAPPPR